MRLSFASSRRFRISSLLFGLMILGVWLLMPNPVRADTPSSLDEYRQAVAQALALTQQANALASAQRASLLTQAADTLAKINTVQLPSGASAPIDNTALILQIRDANKTDAALGRLTALREALAQAPVTLNPADLQTLHNILNAPPFAVSGGNSFLQSLINAVIEFLDRLLTNTAKGVFDYRDLFVVAGIVLVIVVVFFLIRALRHNLVTEEVFLPATPQDQVRSPGEAFTNAQQFANAGDYRSAVRQLYLATLLILDQRGKLKYDPTLTNREYLRQTASDPRANAALIPIVETFDRTWYGFEPISVEEFDDYRRRVEQVRAL